MFKKTILLAGLAAASVFSCAHAGLILKNQINANAPMVAIAVYCGTSKANEIKGKFDIPANGQLGPLPWVLISGMFDGNPIHLNNENLECSFKQADGPQKGKVVGTAHMLLTLSTGTITNVSITDSAHYSVNNAGWGTAHPNMTVTLTRTN